MIPTLIVSSIASLSVFAQVPPSPPCGANQHWVRAHSRKAYTRSDGTRVSASEVQGHCHDNPRGYAYWKSKIRAGKPKQWPNRREAAKPWTDEETERMLEALSPLPERLREPALEGFFRMGSSQTPGNPASGHGGQISIYDKAFQGSIPLERILAHELAHVLFENLPRDQQLSYKWATNWSRVNPDQADGNPKYIARKCCYVENDGDLSPSEDFSNNIEYFLFHPLKLKDTTPNAYQWIHSHFGAKFGLGR